MADVSSEYWAYNDPRWAADPSYGNPETMKYMGPWDQVLQATGFTGRVFQPAYTEMEDPNGGTMLLESGQQYTPEAKAAIDQLRSSGYDLRWKHPDRSTYNTYWGFVTPEGVQDIKFEGSDVGNIIKPLIKTWGAGLGLAGLGAGINSLLGGAGAGTGIGAGTAVGAANALTPAAIEAGLGTAGYGFNAGAATSGAFAPTAIGAGAALPFESILSSGGGTGALTAADIFGELGDVLASGGDAAASAGSAVEGANLAGQAAEAVTSPYSLSSGTTSGTTGIIPGVGGITGITPVTTTPLGAATGAAIDIAPALGASLGATTSALPVGSSLGATTAGATAAAPVAATAGAAGGGAGIAEGMVPGGLTSAGIPATLPEAAAAGAIAAGAGTGGSILDQVISFFRSPAGGAALSGLGSVIGGITQANAAQAASDQQAEAARNALALQREMFEYQKNLLAPYQKYGTAALERLSGALGLEGAAKSQQMLEMDPGYGFRLGEGLKALERMQSARGSMLSGGAMKAGQRYAQDYASGEYGNAYNRLANIAGLGQTVGGQLGTAAQQFGTSAGNVMGQEANALAAGRIGRGSAYGNAIQGGLNAYSNYLNQQQQNQLFRDIFGRTAIGN